jgi:anti-sigma factor RsiW
MAQCSEINLLLGAFEDGELEPHEMQEVARHLAHCPSCEKTLAAYGSLGRLLRDTVAVPALNGFSDAVLERIHDLRPPLTTRIRRRFDVLSERFGAAAGLAVAMGAAAALTIVLATPVVRNIFGIDRQDVTMVSREGGTPTGNPSSPATLTAASNEPGTIISRLETSNPDVAVWSEPSQGTTVIWLPDQH